MKTRAIASTISFFTILSHFAIANEGAWKAAEFWDFCSDTGEEIIGEIRVWDTRPQLNLKFSWTGSRNAQSQAEGEGVLTWYRETDFADNIDSTFQGTFRNGKANGHGRIMRLDGTTYIGQWQDGHIHGIGRLFLPNGDAYEGEFVSDKFHGPGTYSTAAGITHQGTWANGQPHGNATTTLENGKSYPSEWQAGVETAASLAKAAETRALAQPIKQFDISLDHSFMMGLLNDSENEGDNALLYRSRFHDGKLHIEPNFNWFDSFREHGHVPFGSTISPIGFSIGPVPLILNIINSGTTTQTILGGRVQVSRSAPDLQPIIVTYGADADKLKSFPYDYQGSHARENPNRPLPPYFMSFGITNFGHGQARGCTLEFHIHPLGTTPAVDATPIVKSMGTLNDRLSLDLTSVFAARGVDIAKLMRLKNTNSWDTEHTPSEVRAALGEFARFDKDGKWVESNARLTGILRYSWADADGNTQAENLPVQALVVLDPREGTEFGAAGPIEGGYHIALQADGRDYAAPFPIRARLQPGESKRLQLRLTTPASARHEFAILLQTTDGEELTSPPVSLHYYMPPGYQNYIRHQKVDLLNP